MSLLKQSEGIQYKQKYEDLLEKVRLLEQDLMKERRSLIKSEQKLTHNPVTGLPNSLVVGKEFEKLLTENDSPKAVAFFALDDFFRLLKKTFSTKIPEWILYQTSIRLQEACGDQAKVYHTREEEFLVLFKKIGDPKSLYTKLRKIILIMEENHIMGGFTLSLGTSCGVAFFPQHGKTKGDLLRNADIALTEGREAKLSVKAFEPRLKSKTMERMEIQHGIHHALSQVEVHEQFKLFLQPQVKVKSLSDGSKDCRIIGAEALIRWQHPNQGLINPERFIPIAEETGLIVPLTKWVIHKAVRILEGWKMRGFNDLTLSINLSTHQFAGAHMAQDIFNLVEHHEIDPQKLKLEITESGIMGNFKNSQKNLQELKDAGFPILLDDFGTGYSSLAYLKDLPINVIKIDRSFVQSIMQDQANQALVKAIVQVAKDLGKGLIVEGVEEMEQVRWLYDQGCDIFQGYYFSQPLPEKEFFIKVRDERLLKNNV